MENEINLEYVYMTIPSKYVCVYHKLLAYMADFGKTLIDDCNAMCVGKGKSLIKCWNLFQSAMACYQLDMKDKADLFIKYIIAELDNIYRSDRNTVYDSAVVLPISKDGKVKALVTCKGTDIKFEIDPNTGILKQIKSETETKDFRINNNGLEIIGDIIKNNLR